MEKYSILVVDDEPTNFEVIETLLEHNKYDVYYAGNGQEALANLDSFNPDVILLDLMMPAMDGLELCQRIRLMRKWRSIPIVMVTSASGKSILAQCLDAGADDFINKPVDGLELRATVNSMIRTKKQFDRIESLLKLQQNNINSLENDFSELISDLAMSFVSELHTPLAGIQQQLEDLGSNTDNYSKTQVHYFIDLAHKSAVDIQKTTYKFWTYLDFAAEKKQVNSNESCDIKDIIEQVSIVQFQWLNRERDLAIDLERANVAVTAKHCELIIKELLDNALKFSEIGFPIEICGKVSDRAFHLWIKDGRSDDAIDRVFDRIEPDEHQELGLGFKVVKKIVDMYDGCFAINNNDRNQTTVYLTLPLAQQQNEKS